MNKFLMSCAEIFMLVLFVVMLSTPAVIFAAWFG